MLFTEMAKVLPVFDREIITSISLWIMRRKTETGGYTVGNTQGTMFAGVSENTTNAYVVYALTSAGYKDEVAEQIAALQVIADLQIASNTRDAYFLSLVGASFSNLNNGK